MMEHAVLVPWWRLGSDTGQSESFEMLSNTDTPERKLEVMKSVVDLLKLKQNQPFDFSTEV